MVQNFVGNPTSVEATDALGVEVLKEVGVCEGHTLRHLLESQPRESHINLDAVKRHLDDWYKCLGNSP